MSETYADKAARVTAELRTVVREGHEAIKDMRALLKEIREVRSGWENDIEGQVESELSEMLRDHLDSIKKKMNEVGEETTKKMYQRFEKIMAILMGEEKGDDETLDDLARQVRVAVDHSRIQIPKPIRKGTL